MFQEFLQLFFVLIVFLGVLGLTYWVTKNIANVNKRMSLNKNMEIIEILPLMQGHYLYIIRAGEKYLLLGCSQKGQITYINEIEEEQLILSEEKAVSFQEQFMHFMKGRQVKDDEKKG